METLYSLPNTSTIDHLIAAHVALTGVLRGLGTPGCDTFPSQDVLEHLDELHALLQVLDAAISTRRALPNGAAQGQQLARR